MPKKIIHIKNPSSGSNFRTIDGGTKKGNCPDYPVLTAIIERLKAILAQLFPKPPKGEESPDGGGSTEGGGGGTGSTTGTTPPKKPTPPTPAKEHHCPSWGEVARKIDRMLQRIEEARTHHGEGGRTKPRRF